MVRCLLIRPALNSFLSDLHDSGFDDVLEFLLGLIPDYQPLTAWIGGHVGVAELDGFRFAGFPVLKGHELFGHSVNIVRGAGSDQARMVKGVTGWSLLLSGLRGLARLLGSQGVSAFNYLPIMR